MEKTKKIYEIALFIFRRDLRLFDNTALIQASKSSKSIMPAFFLDERQIQKNRNAYFSSNCVQFMLESLLDLNEELNQSYKSGLRIFYGNLNNNLENLFAENKNIGAVYVNEDYTPFSIKRDNEIKELCKKYKIDFHTFEDLMLTNLKEVMTPKGEFFKIYTPYCQEAMKYPVRKPDEYLIDNFISNKNENKNGITNDENDKSESREILNYDFDKLMNLIDIEYNPYTEIKGGRKFGYQIVKNMTEFKDYGTTRNLVKLPSTRLSAYLKFGCISIREVYNAIKTNFGGNHELVKQLQWRDFFMKITYFYPYVIGNSFKPECDHIKWQAKPEDIEAWKNAKTGFPIVDAAMRCLNKTGYIHNKLRTMVCSFLVKDVLADWRIGEQYFANQLIDYDISLNNGGWQWTGSTGTDPRGEPRIYNPVMQAEKLDPNCEFILKWIPELSGVKPNHIHDWEKYNHLYNVNYPKPIFSHYEQRDKAFKMFLDCKNYRTNYKSQFNSYSNNYSNYNKTSYSNYSNYNKNYSKKNYSEYSNVDYDYSEDNTNFNDNHTYEYENVEKNDKYKINIDNTTSQINLKTDKINKKTSKKNNNYKQENNIMNMIYGGKNNLYK